jgi:hypothetical protein
LHAEPTDLRILETPGLALHSGAGGVYRLAATWSTDLAEQLKKIKRGREADHVQSAATRTDVICAFF